MKGLVEVAGGAATFQASTPIGQIAPAGNVPGIFENHLVQKLRSPKSLLLVPPIVTLEITTDADPVLVTVTSWGMPSCPGYNGLVVVPKVRLVGDTVRDTFGAFTVKVKLCVALLPTPLLAVKLRA
jgi:hypothetical protein